MPLDYFLTSHKRVFQTKTSACRDGTLKKTAKQDGNDTTTHSQHPYILCHFANFLRNSLFSANLIISHNYCVRKYTVSTRVRVRGIS